MATRKPKTPELADAANDLAAAVQHVREAVSHKLDAIGALASAELNKAMLAAQAKGGRAEQQFDVLWAKAQRRLLKASDEAKKSLHGAVRQAEKRMEAARKTAQATLADLTAAGMARVAAKKATAKPATARKSLAVKATARTPRPRKLTAK
ncbi:MAG TPA: hypothetical protein VFL86_00885 [Burkholderiaceae bacterium]|nr:hypothetical protein [Burkholderiaceae bacterium]